MTGRAGLGTVVEARSAPGGRLAPDLADLLVDELVALRRQVPGGRLFVAAVPIAPGPIDPIGLIGAALAARVSVAAWFQSPGRILVGAGSALEIPLQGPGRFDGAARSWRALAAEAVVGGPGGDLPEAGPILLGGATFAVAPSTDPRWRGFEAGWLRLPQFLVVSTERGWLALATCFVETPPAFEAALDELRRLFSQPTRAALVATGPADRASALPALRLVGAEPDRRSWESAVARMAGAVGRGRLDKVVLARRVDLEAEDPIDIPAVLRNLATTDPTATRFAFSPTGAPERVFLGASPERLVEVRGRAFRTMALAGTAGRGHDPEEDERLAAALLASEKDHEEHAVVVAMLRSTLEPLTERLEVGRGPEVLRLRTVQHLATPMSGRLRDGEGILGLVSRLHPTPAVGGWPREAALALLEEEEERLDRGWYAGPVGWVDAAGDGEFVVGIRSGIVDGSRASLFAGCGIVADSEPDREWEESEIKLEALAGALGRLAGRCGTP